MLKGAFQGNKKSFFSLSFLLPFPRILIALQINFYRGLWSLLPGDISLSCLQPNEKAQEMFYGNEILPLQLTRRNFKVNLYTIVSFTESHAVLTIRRQKVYITIEY